VRQALQPSTLTDSFTQSHVRPPASARTRERRARGSTSALTCPGPAKQTIIHVDNAYYASKPNLLHKQ
jgi:hypothetical protein